MEQPGFFDRMKTRFTQNAAGTTDLSNLTEEQQKLLRRQFIGRLGSSLAQTGDFGAGMAEQTEAAKGMQAQMQAEALRRQRAGYFDGPSALNPEQGALVQPGGVAPPAAPRLLNPASTNPQPGVPAAQAPAQAASPAVQQTNPRELFVTAMRVAAEKGDFDAVDQFQKALARLPQEKFEYTATLGADGKPVYTQMGEFGTTRETAMRPREVAAIEEAQRYNEDPSLLDPQLRLRAAGATRVNTTNQPANVWDREYARNDADNFNALRTDAQAAAGAITSLDALEGVLSQTQTGLVPGLIANAARAFGVDAGTDFETAAGLVMPLVAAEARTFGTGNGFTDKDREFLVNAQPGMLKSGEANQALYRFLRARAVRRIERFQSANAHRRQFGNTLDWEDPLFGVIPEAVERDAGAVGGAMPRFGTPEWAEWAARRGGTR